MADRRKPKAGQMISGTHGYLWWNGSIVYETSSFEAKIKSNRETVQFAGEMFEDSKLMSVSGEWSAKIKKIYSRAYEMAQAIKEGKDVRATLISKLEDPDNGGTERIKLTDCWFDELTLQSFENGKIVEDEFGGGFSDFNYLDKIADPCA